MPSPFTQNGYIYVIANQDLTKIGITTDLKRRMKELKPDKIYATAWLSSFESLERKLHARYSSERIPQTEYFRLSQFQLDNLIQEVKNIEEAEQKKTREDAQARKSGGQEETDEEFWQSVPAMMTEAGVEKAGKEKAHPDYLSTLSWSQKTFGDHGKYSDNFDKWYKTRSHQYESEEMYKEIYKKQEDLTASVLNIMAKKGRDSKRKRRNRY